MITGGHSIIYSKGPEADRAFQRGVLTLTTVDVGDGWLIFGLPPAEVAIHPSNENNVHEFFLMCDDVQAFLAETGRHHIACEPVQDRGCGLVTQVTLPCGGKLGVYQPRHARPKAMRVKAAKRGAKRAGERPKNQNDSRIPKKQASGR